MSSPARHARHKPQVISGWQITVSPTSTLVTAEPTSSTHPEFSCPGTYGRSVLIRILYRLPLALDDVDVRAAEPRRPDAYDHIERTLYLRLVYLLDL